MIRLYPATKDSAVLEELCGVPAGTHDILKELESRPIPDQGSQYANEEARFVLIESVPYCDILDGFLTNGWGRAQMLPEDAGYAGVSTDPDIIRMSMTAQGVGHLAERVIQTGGMHWS